MPGVIERLRTTVNEAGEIVHDDHPVTWEYAERYRGGRKLDRRRNYAFIEGKLCTPITWTSSCSGCTHGHEDRGSGCEECGYQGRTRQSIWMPESYTI